MILLDILNKTIIDEQKRDILNFLSRPIISSNKNKNEKQDIFYENLFEALINFIIVFMNYLEKPIKTIMKKD